MELNLKLTLEIQSRDNVPVVDTPALRESVRLLVARRFPNSEPLRLIIGENANPHKVLLRDFVVTTDLPVPVLSEPAPTILVHMEEGILQNIFSTGRARVLLLDEDDDYKYHAGATTLVYERQFPEHHEVVSLEVIAGVVSEREHAWSVDEVDRTVFPDGLCGVSQKWWG